MLLASRDVKAPWRGRGFLDLAHPFLKGSKGLGLVGKRRSKASKAHPDSSGLATANGQGGAVRMRS